MRLVIAIVAACLAASPLAAQQPGGPPCAPRDVIAANLAEDYGEHPAGRGVNEQGLLMELFVSPAGTWTMVVSGPRGVGCIVSVGEGWSTAPATKGRES